MNLATPVETAAPCPVCNAPTRVMYRDLYDDRYGYPDAFTLYACDACGHMHIPTHFTPEDLGKLYTQYYPRGHFDIEEFQPEEEKSGFLSWFKGDGAGAFRRVPRNVRVLDIGCGIGATLAYHKARGCEAIGMEADQNVQPIAQRYGLDIRQGIFDGSQFDSSYFDYVTLDQVAEHVTDPHALMRGMARVLKPGGKVIITTPNPQSTSARIFGRKWLNWHVPYHIQFYSRESLTRVAEGAGLKLVKMETTTPSEWQLYQWIHVMQFPERGQRSYFWSPRHVPPRRYPVLELLMGVARRLHMQRWISRMLDLVGAGDNHVFILQKPELPRS
jgi:SAM-dependent methyltransferase